MQTETKNARSAQEVPNPQKISEQVKSYIDNNLQELNEHLKDLKYGDIKFEIRDGKVWRAFISNSILFKGK
jgi:hypothetical protein